MLTVLWPTLSAFAITNVLSVNNGIHLHTIAFAGYAVVSASL